MKKDNTLPPLFLPTEATIQKQQLSALTQQQLGGAMDLLLSENEQMMGVMGMQPLTEQQYDDMKAMTQQITKIVVTDEPMIKTTTGKVKRFEETKKL